MTGLVLSDDAVAAERNVILEERNQRIDNEPGARLSEQVQAAQYLNHPYHRPTIGWRHEMETLNREDALAFYKRFYVPDNAVLVVAGDVTADEVKALAEKTYGKIARERAIAPRVRPQEPPQIAERRVTFADLRVTQPSLQRSYLVPVLHHREGQRGRSARPARLCARRRLEQPALSRAGDGEAARDQYRRLVPRHVARQHALRLLRHARDRRCAREA